MPVTGTTAPTTLPHSVVTTYGLLLFRTAQPSSVGEKIWFDGYEYTVIKISANIAIVE